MNRDDTPCVEPARRLCGGYFGWVYHRFPIKGGITPREVRATDVRKWNKDLAAMLNRPSTLFKYSRAGIIVSYVPGPTPRFGNTKDFGTMSIDCEQP